MCLPSQTNKQTNERTNEQDARLNMILVPKLLTKDSDSDGFIEDKDGWKSESIEQRGWVWGKGEEEREGGGGRKEGVN